MISTNRNARLELKSCLCLLLLFLRFGSRKRSEFYAQAQLLKKEFHTHTSSSGGTVIGSQASRVRLIERTYRQ